MREAPAPTKTQGASGIPNAESVGQDLIQAKRFATLKAEFAMRGHVLREICTIAGQSSYLAERWGLVRWLEDLDSAESFLRQIGG